MMSMDAQKINEICSLYKTGNSMLVISEKLNISHNTVRYYLEKNKISRRNQSEAGYLTHLQRFHKLPYKLKNKLNIKEEKLKVAGIMLYWAEGFKKNNQSTVAFSNSDPIMISLFLKFLRDICGVQEQRLRALIFLFKDQDEPKLRLFWSKVTSIPVDQFNNSFIRNSKSNIGTYKRKSEYGTLLLRYADKRLIKQIMDWIEEYAYLNSDIKPL